MVDFTVGHFFLRFYRGSRAFLSRETGSLFHYCHPLIQPKKKQKAKSDSEFFRIWLRFFRFALFFQKKIRAGDVEVSGLYIDRLSKFQRRKVLGGSAPIFRFTGSRGKCAHLQVPVFAQAKAGIFLFPGLSAPLLPLSHTLSPNPQNLPAGKKRMSLPERSFPSR